MGRGLRRSAAPLPPPGLRRSDVSLPLLAVAAAALALTDGLHAQQAASAAAVATPPPPSEAVRAYAEGRELLASGAAADAVRSFELALARGYRPPEEAWLGLGRAHRRIPLHAFRAIRALRSAIRAEPAPLEALYEYADAYLDLDGWEGEREGRRALLRILRRDPTYRDTFQRWAALYPDRDEMASLARELTASLERTEHAPADSRARIASSAADLWIQLGQASDASRALDLWRAGEPAPPAAWHYWRARLLFLEGRDAEATDAFGEGLSSAATPADLTPYRRDVEPLVSPEELASLAALDVGAQVGAIRTFWETRDLTPFSPANERLAEHYRRLADVRRRYLWKKPLAKEKTLGAGIDDLGRPSFDTRAEGRSVDDRGTLYLLHGEPDRRHVELGGAEFWSYRRPDLPGGRLQFHFKRMDGPMGLGNDAVYSIAPTTDLGLGNVRRGREIEDGISHTRAGLAEDTWSADAEQPLRLALRPYTFRNAADPSRTDVILALEAELREGARRGRDDAAEPAGDTGALEPGALVRRLRLYGEDVRGEHDVADTVRVDARPRARRLPAGALLLAGEAPGTRRYALQLEEPATGAFGAVRGELDVPSYAGAGPRLSSVLLTSGVRTAAGAADPAAIRRGGLTLRPMVAPRASRGAPLHLYYEVYDLQAGPDGRARYRIEYRVTSTSEKPGLLSRLLGKGWSGGDGEVSVAFEQERAGGVEVSPETFALDTSALEPGPYRLTVAVLDRAGGREVERSVDLDVLE